MPLAMSKRSRHGSAASDRLLILAIAFVILGAGIGMRDPWPADEPRFALIAREMVDSGDWIIPHRAGEIYAEKPPLFFWFMASIYLVTGSLRVAFLLPSLLAGIGVVLLTHDLLLRLWSRRTARLAALTLLFTIQFTNQARSAQIDAFLLFWTTLAVYAFLRHRLIGARTIWWYLGWFASGLGVITKGVGFLPLLILIPLAYARRRGWKPAPATPPVEVAHRIGGVLAFLAAISIWLVPMLIAVEHRGDPDLLAYRDNILLKQTGERYARAWHHRRWAGYFVVETIPWAWLPLTLTFPWTLPAAWRRIRRRDARIFVPLAWTAIVILFFSMSPGKRGIYVLPALPACVIALAPLLPGTFRLGQARRLARIALWSTTAILVAIGVVLWTQPAAIISKMEGIDPYPLVAPVLALTVFSIVVDAAVHRRRLQEPVGIAAMACAIWLILGLAVFPLIDDNRSARSFMKRVAALAGPGRQLGIVAWREQLALQSDRPVTTFGYGRRDLERETMEAAAWLGASENRRLLVPRDRLQYCCDESRAIAAGHQGRHDWFLIGPEALDQQ